MYSFFNNVFYHNWYEIFVEEFCGFQLKSEGSMAAIKIK